MISFFASANNHSAPYKQQQALGNIEFKASTELSINSNIRPYFFRFSFDLATRILLPVDPTLHPPHSFFTVKNGVACSN